MVCDYCRKEFVRESAFLSHMCEQKRREFEKDRPHVRMGFQAYLKFHEVNFRNRNKPSYEKFRVSRYYRPFVDFGKYLCDINAIEPMRFAEWMMSQGVAEREWTKDLHYERYVRDLCKKESPERAVERCLMLMKQWSIDNDEHWTDFFRNMATPLAVMWIRSGRISPWVLYATSSGQALLGRLSEEQIALVHEYIDPRFWKFKINKYQDEIKDIKKILADAGV